MIFYDFAVYIYVRFSKYNAFILGLIDNILYYNYLSYDIKNYNDTIT